MVERSSKEPGRQPEMLCARRKGLIAAVMVGWQVYGFTALMLAAQTGRSETVRALIDAKADVKIVTNVRRDMLGVASARQRMIEWMRRGKVWWERRQQAGLRERVGLAGD